MIRCLTRWSATVPAVACGGSFMAAVDHNAFLAWVGAGVAGAGFVLNSVLSSYHRVREARRAEDSADRAALLESTRAYGRMQIELENRIAKSEHDATELAERFHAIIVECEQRRCLCPLLNPKLEATP